jgi:hypothetical protein
MVRIFSLTFMKKIFLLVLTTLVFACQGDKFDPENLIVGKWKLVSYCRPEETNTCNNVVVPAAKGVYVEFSKRGSFNETYKNTIPIEYAFLGCGGGGYEMENGDVRIHASCMSSLSGRLIKISSVSKQKLVLIPFENGEYRFERE